MLAEVGGQVSDVNAVATPGSAAMQRRAGRREEGLGPGARTLQLILRRIRDREEREGIGRAFSAPHIADHVRAQRVERAPVAAMHARLEQHSLGEIEARVERECALQVRCRFVVPPQGPERARAAQQRHREVGVDRQRLPVARLRLVVPLEAGQREAAMVVRPGQTRLQHDRPVAIGQRLGVPLCRTARAAAVAQRVREIGLNGERPVVARDRFVQALHVLQDGAADVEHFRRRRRAREPSIDGVERLVEAAEVLEDRGAIPVRRREVRVQRQRMIAPLERFVATAQRQQDPCEIGVGLGRLRIGAERADQQRSRLVETAPLPVDERQQVQRIEVIGLRGKNRVEPALRLVQVSLGVKVGGAPQGVAQWDRRLVRCGHAVGPYRNE